MMCKVLIFGCIAAVILMTAAYGAPLKKTKLSPAQKEAHLQASIIDLTLLKDIDNVSGDFLVSEDSFVFGFFLCNFFRKINFPPSFSTEFS